MQVEIKITATVMTSRYGTLMNGDILRTDAEFAAHLVNECKAGEYTTTAEPIEAKQKRKSKD